MTAGATDASERLIASIDDLIEPLARGEKPESAFRIGAEMEKPPVDAKTGEPIPYEGERSVSGVLEDLVGHHGWQRYSETEGGPLVALTRGQASLTLEPAAQLELSGAPAENVHQVCSEFRGHMRELRQISESLGIAWLGLGFHPFANREELPWVPKQRYGIMREYLPTRGSHALDMMQRTATVQANVDYASEADAMKKLGVCLRIAPVLTAMFANSPWVESRRYGGVSYRARVWLDVDPDRTGLIPRVWTKGAGYAEYVEWALDVPMFFVKRDSGLVMNTGQTFRAFWKDGFEGHRATMTDWKTHLNTLFPEARLKGTLEVRGADAQGARLTCALPALVAGLLYSDEALDRVDAHTRAWSVDEVEAARQRVHKDGLATPFRERSVKHEALEIIDIALSGLEARGKQAPSGKDETCHLIPLRALIEQGLTPAEALIRDVPDGEGFVGRVIDTTRIPPG